VKLIADAYNKAIELRYSGESEFVSIKGRSCEMIGFRLIGPHNPDRPRAKEKDHRDVGIKMVYDEATDRYANRCVIRHNSIVWFDIGIWDDGFANKLKENTISHFRSNGLRVDNVSSGYSQGNYFTTKRSGTTYAMYIKGTHYESYSDVFAKCHTAIYIDNIKSMTVVGGHFEGPQIYDVYSNDATSTINLTGGRIIGRFRAGASRDQGTRFILDGISSKAKDIAKMTFKNCGKSRFEFRNCRSFDLDNILDLDFVEPEEPNDYRRHKIGVVRWFEKESYIVSTEVISISEIVEDILHNTTLPQYLHHSYGGFRILAAGNKSGINGNKTLKLHIGSSSYTFHPPANNENDWHLDSTVLFRDFNTQRILYRGYDGTTLTQGLNNNDADFFAGPVTVKITGECSNSGDTINQTMWKIDLIPRSEPGH
jgi:hypothetical protein